MWCMLDRIVKGSIGKPPTNLQEWIPISKWIFLHHPGEYFFHGGPPIFPYGWQVMNIFDQLL